MASPRTANTPSGKKVRCIHPGHPNDGKAIELTADGLGRSRTIAETTVAVADSIDVTVDTDVSGLSSGVCPDLAAGPTGILVQALEDNDQTIRLGTNASVSKGMQFSAGRSYTFSVANANLLKAFVQTGSTGSKAFLVFAAV